jgi:hypothetical protein
LEKAPQNNVHFAGGRARVKRSRVNAEDNGLVLSQESETRRCWRSTARGKHSCSCSERAAAAGEWLMMMSQSAELPSKQELASNFHLQSERNTKLTLEGAANYCFAWQAGPVATVSIPAKLNMSRASSQPATLRAEITPA